MSGSLIRMTRSSAGPAVGLPNLSSPWTLNRTSSTSSCSTEIGVTILRFSSSPYEQDSRWQGRWTTFIIGRHDAHAFEGAPSRTCAAGG